MTELTSLLDQALLAATFRTHGGTVYSPGELRDSIARASGRMSEARELLSARLEVGDDWVDSLAEFLRSRLSTYMDVANDEIGHSFRVEGDSPWRLALVRDQVQEIHSVSGLVSFAKGVIRAAAILGPPTVTGLLTQWANGDFWKFKVCVVLAGVYVEGKIGLNEGLRVGRLPIASDSLPVSMPDMQWESVARVLGHALLEVDASRSPALFAPAQGGAESVPLLTHTALGPVSLETFYLALSLVCNRRVGPAWSWNDYGDVAFFTAGERSGLAGPVMLTDMLSTGASCEPETGITKLTSFKPLDPNLNEEGLRRAWALCEELQRRIDSEQRFQIAVTRWAQAATPGVLNADRVVDLRIALEALYLDSSEAELGFRLSVTGARHLGKSLEDRKEIRRSLADFYRLASRVIHGATLAKDANVLLVDRAATLCRDGILKIVEERSQLDWTELLLS